MKAVVIFGDESLGGIYLLRLRVVRDTAVHFGRFRGGQAITVPAGDCLYVGSAMRGLAARLLRHASRTAVDRPHPIRAEMMAAFVDAGLVKAIRPFSPKRLHWHIDYLLEQPALELIQVFVLRSAVRLETAVARQLAQDPATFIIAPGLGARDDPGGTHLLGVRADAAWWRALPLRLRLLDESAKSAHNL
jgi:Uri superfamily endonuclease